MDAGPMAMALTFDDGPGPYATAELLTVLRQYGVTATFFVIGANVEKDPRLARRIARRATSWATTPVRAADPGG
ncbi:polysaccharide deacetylase family protein [Kitasatospora sp. NPDC001603]|uniref:polysaccharide deacetylase family protein n=1 Tax=Kitasatospora sp. NPDC001603 TaxID=3154388 RepID=UPI003323BE8E